MPTNLYGAGDNYHPENSHVIPAIIRRLHEAKINNQATVTIWGTGTPRREFLYSDDMADACLYLMNLPEEQFKPLLALDRNDGLPPLVNIGTGVDATIKELAELVGSVVGYNGELEFDSTKPDGTMRKLMDVGLIRSLGWQSSTCLYDGLVSAYKNYLTYSVR
jgi:GDP-L-fucose synthase